MVNRLIKPSSTIGGKVNPIEFNKKQKDVALIHKNSPTNKNLSLMNFIS